MAAVKWKEPFFTWTPVMSLLILMLLLPSWSQSQWISYRRSGRHSSNLWHPNMPAHRTLRHSHSGSSSSSNTNSNNRSPSSSNSNNGNSRPIDHRSSSHSNFYTINSPKEQQQSSGSNGAYHHHYQQSHQHQSSSQARYSSADFGRGSSSHSSGKNVRISEIPARSSPSSPTAPSYQQHQRSMAQHHHRDQISSNVLSHRHLPTGSHAQPPKSNKVNWQQSSSQPQASSSSSKNGRSGMYDSTRRPVSQQAGHLLDSWPNSNTHHHLAPIPSTGASFKQNGKSGFSNLKPEQWGNSVLVSNKPIELKPKTSKANKQQDDNKKATDRQLILPSGYPVKDKTAVANTINTLTKLSPKKPIFVFMRKEGLMAVKAGADAGDVIKKLAGTSKLPFYNGTNALPTHNMPTVFLAPEDMGPPTGYGKIPIPNLKPKNATPKPTYSKILMPGGTHMKGSLVTTSTTTVPPPTAHASSTFAPLNLDNYGALSGLLFQNNSISGMSIEQKLQLLQLLRSQPNHPLADQAALAILASATPSPLSPSPSPSVPVPSAVAPPQSLSGLGGIVQGPTLALPTAAHPNALWPPQLFPGAPGNPQGFGGLPPSAIPGLHLGVLSTTPAPLGGVPSSVSPSPSAQDPTVVAGSENDIHKLIGTIVESAVSNTVSSMLQHQRILQHGQNQPSLIGVGPPLHAPNLPVGPLQRPPPPLHFGRGPPPPRPQGPPRFPPYQQRAPFPPSPVPGRFPPHPSAVPLPSVGSPGPLPNQPNPSSIPPQQQHFPSPSPVPQQLPTAIPASPQNPTGAPHPSPFPQQHQHLQQQPSQQHAQFPGPVQHPLVPQFQLPPAYQVSSTPQPVSPAQIYNPSSTAAPLPYPQQQQPQLYYPNGMRPLPPNAKPGMRMVERPFSNKPRNPIHNALQFFGISTPRPDLANKSPTPSGQPAIMSSTPYPRPPSPTPFGRPGPGGPPPFPSSTPASHNRFPPLHFPPQQQHIQLPHQLVPQQSQLPVQQVQPQQQQQASQSQQQPQVQVGLQPGDRNGKKPTLVVQTPSGVQGKKNTYVITGGGSELPELNKIMKVLNDLHVDSENSSPSQQHQHPVSSPSSTPQPIQFSPSPTPSSASRSPIPFTNRPTISPNVMIKNSNVGITPSPSPVTIHGLSSTQAIQQQQFISTSTPAPGGFNPSSVRPHIMSSTSFPPQSNVSPVMQIIKSIQQQIPGVQVSPSVQTIAQKQHPSARPIQLSTPRPLVSPSPTPLPIHISSQRPPMISAAPSSIGPIMFSSPRPVSPTPTPSPNPVIISSTGFPRVINVSPSGSDTPASIHQAVVEAIMKQQAAEAGGGSPNQGQIVVTGGGRLPSVGPTSQFIEVIPAGGQIPGLGGNSNSKPFIVQLPPQQQHHQHHPTLASPQEIRHPLSVEEEAHHAHAPFDLNNPSIQIQKGSLESHETYTEKSRKQSVSSVSVSSSIESSERPRPVYSRERYQGEKIHHYSKEVADDDYPEKNEKRRPIYSHRQSKEQYDEEEAISEHLNPNRRMYSGETSKQDIVSEEAKKSSNEPQKLIEKVITEEKIIWRQGPGQGELIPSKVRTEERIIMKPGSKESTGGASGDSEFSQRRTPLSSAEILILKQKQQPINREQSNSAASYSKEMSSPSNFAGILRSKMKFDKMMEKLYPTKQLVSPFTISNNSANFHHSHHGYGEIVPTIASSLITTPQQQLHLSSISPTLQSMFGSTINGMLSSPDQGRFRIRPGDISQPEPSPTRPQQQTIMLGVSPSGQPIFIQSSPSSPIESNNNIVPSVIPTSAAQQGISSSSPPSSSSTVEQRLIFIPQGTAASSPIKSNKPQILITTVDELPDLMAQLSGTNPEIRMVPDKATLEAELAKVAASSTVSVATTSNVNVTSSNAPTITNSPSPSPTPTKPSLVAQTVQSTLFRAQPTPASSNLRRMDGPEKAFTWRPAVNATVASPLSSTLSLDTSRRLVSGLGAGMLHAMSAGFGNIGNGVLNKLSWLGPSAIPPQLTQSQPTQQILYSMQQQGKLPIVGPYQQVMIQPGQQQTVKDMGQGAPLGYFSYKWGGLVQEQQQPPTNPPTVSTESPTKSPDYKLMYRSQYREQELPINPEKLQPVSPVHKLKKGSKVKARTRTTSSPIDPVSAEEYDDDEEGDIEQDDLISHASLVPKHASRGKVRLPVRNEDESSSDESSSVEDETNAKRRQDSKRGKYRRRRPGKLTEDEEEITNKNTRSKLKSVRPTKPTYDEEDDASPPPKGMRTKSHGHSNRGRSDIDRSMEEEEDEEDYDVYDVKPALNVKRKKVSNLVGENPTVEPPSSTTTAKSSSKNKAIYVNREMFLVSGEEKGSKDSNNPKAEPVYQPNQPIPKFPVLQGPSIISGQSVVKKTGSNTPAEGEQALPKPSSTLEPKTTAPSPTTTTTVTTTSTTSKATTTKLPSTKASFTVTKKKGNEQDDYKDAQDELRTLLRKIQDRLSAQDEVYDFGDDAALYDYYDEMQQVLSTKATTTTTTKATLKPKKSSKKGGPKKQKKNKKNKKKSKKNKKNKKNKQKTLKSAVKAVTQQIATRRPVATTMVTEANTTPEVYLHHHQRHPVSSIERFTSFEEKAHSSVTEQPTTTTTTTTTTTVPPTTSPPAQSQSIEETISGEGNMVTGTGTSSQSGSVETGSNVAYVFSETAKDNRPKLKRRPIWIRRRIGSAGALASGEGLQPVRIPTGPNGKVIRLVRRRRPIGARRRLIQQRQQQFRQQQAQQSFEQQSHHPHHRQPIPQGSTETSTPATSTQASIEIAPPNFSSPPLEQYFEQNSLERRVGNSPDSTEAGNGTVMLRSPKRKLKLIRLKGQRAQWRLRLQGTGDEESTESGGLRPAALIAPREVSAPLPLQAPLPAPVFTSRVHQPHQPPTSSSIMNSVRSAKSAKDIKHYSTSYSAESASSSVEAKVCIRGKCEIVSRQ